MLLSDDLFLFDDNYDYYLFIPTFSTGPIFICSVLFELTITFSFSSFIVTNYLLANFKFNKLPIMLSSISFFCLAYVLGFVSSFFSIFPV